MTRNMRRMLALTLTAACSAPAAAQSLEWAEQLGTPDYDIAWGVAMDGAGSLYITGWTDGSFLDPSAGESDCFLAKYDASGALQWTRQFGTSAEDRGYGVAVDGAGGVYLVGMTGGGGWPAGDAFLTKYDDSGELQWRRQFGDITWLDEATGVAVDGAGDVYVTGWGRDGGPSGSNAFLAKYDGSGAQQWMRQLGTPDTDYAEGVAVDGSGGVYIAGRTWGSLGGPIAGWSDAFLAKYDAAGALQWTRQLGTSREDVAWGVAVDGSGGVYITGHTEGSLGGSILGDQDAFLAKYDASGEFQWVRQLGSPFDDRAWGVAVDGAEGVWIAGGTHGSLGGPSAGSEDVFLAKYDASGALSAWTRQLGTSRHDVAYGVAAAGVGDVYLTGQTSGSLGGPSTGSPDAFLAKFKYEETTCYADCNGSFSLDFFDFLCFQNLFAAGDPLADCDGSGTLDFLDFLCFQNGFAAGCP